MIYQQFPGSPAKRAYRSAQLTCGAKIPVRPSYMAGKLLPAASLPCAAVQAMGCQ